MLGPAYALLALFCMPHIKPQLLAASTFLSRCLRNSDHNYAKARADEKFSQGNQIAFCQDSLLRERAGDGGKIISFVENAEFAY